MGSTAKLFGMLEKTAQQELCGSLAKQQQLEQQTKILNENVERADTVYARRTTDSALVGNLLRQRSLSLETKRNCEWKRGEINTEVERKWQTLRQQHHRTQIMQNKEQQQLVAKDLRNDQLTTEERYSHPNNKGFGG